MSLHRRVKRARRKLGGVFLSTCGPSVLARLSRSWRSEVLGQENLDAVSSSGFLISLWHGRMLAGVNLGKDTRWNVLVSPSDDGDLSRKVLDAFGYRVIRGSSSRGGARALREMLEVLRAGECLIITPDGPRGPRHSMNPGLAWMARATRFPILPAGLVTDRAWYLNSWDHFTIPKPRARVVLNYGEPLLIGRDGGDEELERATETIRARMIDAEERGFEYLDAERDW